MGEVTYEVLQSMNPPPFALPFGTGKNTRADAILSGAAQRLPAAMAFYESRRLGWAIDTELARMAPDLKKARGNKRGLLVVVEIKEWPIPDLIGDRAPDVHQVLIGPARDDRGEAYRWWITHDHMFSGLPQGRRLSAIYLWVTGP